MSVLGRYHGNEETDRLLRGWADASGGRREEIGRSLEGRPIWGYHIHAGARDTVARFRAVEGANEAAAEAAARLVSGSSRERDRFAKATGTHVAAAKPRILLLSLVHPMEWIGREALLRFVDSLRKSDPPAPFEIQVVPTVNPDGADRVEQSLRLDRWRWVRGNARGIDLNRNFAAGHRTRSRWIDWWPMWRPGPSPLSEPESRALSEWIEGPLALMLSFHSFGRWFFYPPSSRRDQNDGTVLHHRILSTLARDGVWPDGYRFAQLGRWSRLFRAFGTEIDHFHDQNGGHAYLVEVSRGGAGRWPLTRSFRPFQVFNPPDPESEVELLLPALHGILRHALHPGGVV